MYCYLKDYYSRLLISIYPSRLLRSRRRLTGPLKGRGLEIGPGNLPMTFKHPVKVQYLDTNTQDQLAQYYPKLTFNQLQNFILGDADDLQNIPHNHYDFLVASHVIEHVKNPLRAFKRWVEVVKPGGCLYIIFPNRDECFDKGRPYTTISHLLAEYKLENNSTRMRQNLKAHIYEHYAINDYRNKPDKLKEIDIDAQLQTGAVHYHIWGTHNTRDYFKVVQINLHLPITIIKFEHRMNELRYLLVKSNDILK
jgi:SAM-dependent methyltransferase